MLGFYSRGAGSGLWLTPYVTSRLLLFISTTLRVLGVSKEKGRGQVTSSL